MYQCIECENYFIPKENDGSVIYDETIIIDNHEQDKFAVCGGCND